MAGPDNPDTAAAQWTNAWARARGLGRALELYPEAVAAAAGRGIHALSPLPEEFPPSTEPAATFDAAAAAAAADDA